MTTVTFQVPVEGLVEEIECGLIRADTESKMLINCMLAPSMIMVIRGWPL